MADLSHLQDYLDPVSVSALTEDATFNEAQFAHHILHHDSTFPDVEAADLVLVGIQDFRGEGFLSESQGADLIRRHFYGMYQWHPELRLADMGNLRSGSSLQDSHAALKSIVAELLDAGKTVVILGGSHDFTLAQYQAYASRSQIVEASVIDALIDLQEDSGVPARSFLMEMLTGQPNFLKHYNHIGFQSYFIHPRMLETLDKLRFDCYRLGLVREQLEDMEPVLRTSHMLSVDIQAIRPAEAPANRLSPNGLAGDEACALMRYAGMSATLNTLGLYGYQPALDRDELTAVQLAQMLWYFIEGKSLARHEAALQERDSFWEFHLSFSDMETAFLKSKRTGRWWMQLPNHQFIPCAYQDYVTATKNEIPERWLRAQERL